MRRFSFNDILLRSGDIRNQVAKSHIFMFLGRQSFFGGLSTPTEHPQNSRSYFVSSKILLSYHYVHLMVLMYSSMGISSVNL